MAFYLDDIPAEPFVIEPPETIDLAEFTTATATLTDPDGIVTDLDAAIDVDVVVVDQPAVTVFTGEGIHRLRVQLTGASAVATLPVVRIVVQDVDSQWHTLDTARAEWPDAIDLPDPVLWDLLEVARDQVLTFAPTLEEGTPVPTRYRSAQRVQARNVWNAVKVAPDGTLGGEDFIIRPFPLDWHVKSMLRPTSGTPVVA